MVERTIDKKIRALRSILQSGSLDTYHLSIPYPILWPILRKFERKQLIKIKKRLRCPEFNEMGDPIDILTDEYFFDVIITDKTKLTDLLKEYETQSPKRQTPLIREKALELISREIGEIDNSTGLVKLLKKCGVDKELIVYPSTKWRMINDVLEYFAYSDKAEDKQTLLKILEETSHPLMHGGDEELAKKYEDKFNKLLKYDNFVIKDGVLWEGWDDGVGLSWSDKNGNNFEDKPSYSIIPQQMDKLYVYWNELIKLAKFYFDNKGSQDDEINNIYFEIIANIEELLDGNGCGGLKEIYKKPFRNMMGCEFEIQKQNLTIDDLFVNLYDFLGRITELSLPNKNNIEKVKEDNSVFFAKVQQYSEQRLTRREIIQEPPVVKTQIKKISESEEIIKLSPGIYGISINLKTLFRKIWGKINRKK